jgi:hypothetical protein
VTGKGGRTRVVKISYDAARAIDRYLRVRARHAQAHRAGLWLGTGNRGPLTASGIYQVIARRGRQAGIAVYPHRFRHYFSHTWLDRGGAEGDLMELNGWSSPQMLRRYGASARSARARRTGDRQAESQIHMRRRARQQSQPPRIGHAYSHAMSGRCSCTCLCADQHAHSLSAISSEVAGQALDPILRRPPCRLGTACRWWSHGG